MGEINSDEKKKRGIRRVRRFLIAAVVIGVAVALFPGVWGPPLLSWAVPAVAKRVAGIDMTLPFERVSIGRVTIRNAEIRNVPGAPKIKFAEARASVSGLFGKKIDSVEIDGIALDASALTNSVPRTAGRRAAALALPPDPFCGWTVGSLRVAVDETDLAPIVPPAAAEFVTNTTLRAGLRMDDMKGELLVDVLGYRVASTFSYASAANGAEAHARFSLEGSPLSVAAVFLSGIDGWSLDVTLPETKLSHLDPFIAGPLGRLKIPGVADLCFSGDVSASASVEQFCDDPVPTWNARVAASGVDVSLSVAGRTAGVRGLRGSGGVDGTGKHFDIRPMFPRFDTASFGEFRATNGWASLRATETALLATEAHVGICGGDVRVYSLFLSPEKIDAGFTLFVDDIDTGEFLACMPEFHGYASGRLHGRVPLFVKGGKELRFGKAFLYSTPGEIGKLRVENAAPVTDNLAAAGIPQETCDNLAKALADLDYNVLRFDLNGGEEGCLSVSVRGTSGNGPVAVPVDLTVNFRGALERLINFGLRAGGSL